MKSEVEIFRFNSNNGGYMNKKFGYSMLSEMSKPTRKTVEQKREYDKNE